MRSTIGAARLNFSVRDGKRWIPRAIATLSRLPSLLRGDISLDIGPLKGAPRGEPTEDIRPYRTRKYRAISTARLRTSPPLHLRPIEVIVFDRPRGDLILGPASRLDAFSAYPIRAWVPGGAPGGTTGTPEARPTRSSRTSVRTPQISYAHDR